jgi:hypothetical protein
MFPRRRLSIILQCFFFYFARVLGREHVGKWYIVAGVAIAFVYKKETNRHWAKEGHRLRTKGSVWFRGIVLYFVKWSVFYGEELLAPRPTPKLGDHPLSAVRDCLFKIFAATLHNCRPFLHPQPEDAPCRGDRDPLVTKMSWEAKGSVGKTTAECFAFGRSIVWWAARDCYHCSRWKKYCVWPLRCAVGHVKHP